MGRRRPVDRPFDIGDGGARFGSRACLVREVPLVDAVGPQYPHSRRQRKGLDGSGVFGVTSLREIEDLQDEVNHYQDRVALLRASLYRRGVGTNAVLVDLQRKLASAKRRLLESQPGRRVRH